MPLSRIERTAMWLMKFAAGQLLYWGVLLGMLGMFYPPIWAHFVLFWGLLQVPMLCAAPLIYLSNVLNVSVRSRSLIFSVGGLVLFSLLLPLVLYLATLLELLRPSSAKHFLPFVLGASLLVSVHLYFTASWILTKKSVRS